MTKVSTNKVTVLCSVFNHEDYVQDALEGFISQETSFPFEVVVHDDASTDRSAEIIRRYQQRYPKIIKPIYEKENQYSQGRSYSRKVLEQSDSKYVAICEGDDYWTDPHKLQLQYELMEDNPRATICFANADMVDAITGKNYGAMLPGSPSEAMILDTTGLLGVPEIMSLEFIPTASFFYDRKAWLRIPLLPKGAFSGDRCIQLFLTYFGGALYLNKKMSVYRVNVPGSAMARWGENDKTRVAACWGYVKMYEFFNEYTGGKFSEIMEQAITHRRLAIALLEGNPGVLDWKSVRRQAKDLSIKQMIEYMLLRLNPSLYKTFRRKLRG